MDKISEVIANAIRDEKYFYFFYIKLSEKAKNSNVKEELIRLAKEEQRHQQKLEALKLNQQDDFNSADFDELQASQDAEQIPLDDFKDVKSMLNFAIKQEVIANMTYSKLADSCTDAKIEAVFRELAAEEKKHELLLTGKLSLINQDFVLEW
ncbi:MAG: hypothetical protein ACMXX5_01365 [Candidatus Woesearchaeota archaeon]